MKKIAIFGSRDIDTDRVTEILDELMVKENWYITSGNIKGAAECARKVAEHKGIKITLYNYESGLGFYIALKDIAIKNKKMVAECDESPVWLIILVVANFCNAARLIKRIPWNSTK